MLKDGDQIIYAREDSGADFPVLGLFLAPGEALTVGDKLDADLAERFVEEGICKPFPDPPSAAKSGKTTAAKSADAVGDAANADQK